MDSKGHRNALTFIGESVAGQLAKYVTVMLIVLYSFHITVKTQWAPSLALSRRPFPGSRRLGAVASESSVCSQIGTEVLRQGGNAADAVISTTLCVGVISMYHSGIGGGGFAVVRSRDGSYEMVDFREAAPSAAFEDMFKERPQDSIDGGLASGIPGEIRGLEYIYRKYASLPWKKLVEPAIRVARDGFLVGEDLDRCINSVISNSPHNYDFFTHDSNWALDFAPNGTRLRVGDRMFRKRYANTLEQLAIHGANSFYHGPIADSIVQTINKNNGNITSEDLQEYSARNMKISNITYNGHRLFSTTAPSSGAIALSTLKILEGYTDMFEQGTTNLSNHRLVEAMKFAYAQRLKLGDPSFVLGMDQYQDQILTTEAATKSRARISDDYTLDPDTYDTDGYGPSRSGGTSHIVSADWTGLSISLTTTVNLYFGSKVMVPDTGIILNNVMNDFAIPGTSNEYGYVPSPANFIRPRKRPLSSSTPVIVEDVSGNLRLVIGAAGGSRIISSTIQCIIHVLNQNMSITDALRQHRLHDQLIPKQTEFEFGFDSEVVAFMKALGHNVTMAEPTLSAVQGIIRLKEGTFDAAGDPRQHNSGGASV